MARGFGLGAPTGIEQIPEASGQILDPQSQVDAVNQAIGQGDVQVTPLQVARFMAAIANGGTLYRPQIVESDPADRRRPETCLPSGGERHASLRDENLAILQEALFMVTNFNRGTARNNIRGIQFDTAGKTGTAESGSGLPHAWFAGYTLNEEEERASRTLPSPWLSRTSGRALIMRADLPLYGGGVLFRKPGQNLV
jgi:cell division protein FtsI/penicillin-binding protein 2